jgi:hypothetical protein
LFAEVEVQSGIIAGVINTRSRTPENVPRASIPCLTICSLSTSAHRTKGPMRPISQSIR